MKLLISLLLSLSASLSNAADVNMPCDVVKTIATLPDTESKLYGNAFAIDKDTLMATDHSFFHNQNQLILIAHANGKMVPAEIVARDFHTDTAVLRLKNGDISLKACDYENNLNTRDKPAEVFAFRQETVSPEYFIGQILSVTSAYLAVPGIEKALELGIKGYKSMSGAPAFVNGKVIGMISQVTSEGTILLVPASYLGSGTKHSARSYKIIPEQNKFSFANGFELQFGEGVHEGKGGPHEGKVGGGGVHEGIIINPSLKEMYKINTGNKPISSQKNNELVIINITDLKALSETQPKLAELVASTNAKRIAILSIDGVRIDNNLTLIRTLETCSVCKIDRFLIIDAKAADFKDDYLKLAYLISDLATTLTKLTPNGVVTKGQILFSTLIGHLTYISDMAAKGLNDPAINLEFANNWAKVSNKFVNLEYSITDDVADKLYQIELLIAKLNLIKTQRGL